MTPPGAIIFNPVLSPGSRMAPAPPPRPERPPDDGSIASTGSVLGIASAGSILSIGSVGSVLSIGSSGSVLSIGSAGSLLSIGSIGSVASIGSFVSVGSIGSAVSIGAVGGWLQRPGRVVESTTTALTLAALAVAALRR